MFSSVNIQSKTPGRLCCPFTRFAIAALVLAACTLFASGCAGNRDQAVKLHIEAVMLHELDKNDLAIQKLNSAVKTDKRFYPAYSLLGDIYRQMQQYRQSAQSYEKATALNPYSFKDFLNLGRVYQIMKEFAQAVKAYVRACQIQPHHFEAHLGAAQSYYELRDYNNALAYGQKAEEIDPTVTEIHRLLGNVYGAHKDYEQAIGSYKRALEMDSNDTKVMTSLAFAYLQTDRIEPARDLLLHITQLDPNSSVAYQYLAYCRLLLNDIDGAIAGYTKAIEINKNDWEAERGLGIAYILKAFAARDNAFKAEAVKHWRASLKIKPDQPKADKLAQLIKQYAR